MVVVAIYGLDFEVLSQLTCLFFLKYYFRWKFGNHGKGVGVTQIFGATIQACVPFSKDTGNMLLR